MTIYLEVESGDPPMRRDRDGSWILDEDLGHRCRKGWKGTGPEGQPIPCLVCKPHLARRGTPSGEPTD